MTRFNKPLIAASLLAAPLLAQAEITANVALTSDYVWRGYSQTLEDPAIQGGFDYAHDSGLAVGIWGSNVDFTDEDDPTFAVGDDDGADLEVDLYGSYSGEFGNGIGYSLGLIYYTYPGTNAGFDFDWLEFNAGLSYGPVAFAVNYSSDVYNSNETGVYYSLSVEHEIDGFTLAAGVGYYDYDEAVFGAGVPDSVLDYHLGIATSQLGLDWDLSYYDTDSDGEALYGDIAEGRTVLTVSKSF